MVLLERLLMGFGQSVKPLLFYCSCLPISVLLPMQKLLFWQKMFYSDNLLLSVLARSCKESAVAVADAYNISVFDLLHLNSSHFKNAFWAILLLLLICNGVLIFLVIVFTFQFVVYVFNVSF